MADRAKILVAVAWPYASGPRHIGHVAGFGVPSDVFARYHRLRGSDVLMVSGTDDHGTPITREADREGVTPAEIVRRYNRVITEDLESLGLSYDLFTQTETPNHYEVVQDLFKTLHAKGYLIEETTLGAISPSTGRTLPDRYIEGTCPICGFTGARGDQCDNCGNQLDPTDLIEPHSIDGEVPEFRETTHFMFDLPAFGDQLREWIAKQEHWRPNVRAFSLGFAKDLKPRAVTRDLDWGIPVPLAGWEDQPMKRIYVWFDAVMGYLSASIEWAKRRGRPDAWREWWQNPESRHYYFMGKDNITFHTVMWPSILLGAGDLELPYDVVSSEFLTMEGKKFSSSRRVVIYVRDFLSRYDADALRYYLSIAGPETQDTDFTWSEFVRRNNDELVGTWGNLVHRTLVNVQRNFGAVPPAGELTQKDREVRSRVAEGFGVVGGHLDAARFKVALQEALRLAQVVNQYLGDEEPWQLIKHDRDRAGSVLHVALQCVNDLRVIFTPFLPFSSQRLHEMLGHDGVLAAQPAAQEVDEAGWTHRVLEGVYAQEDVWRSTDLPEGRELRPPSPLFKKLDEKIVDEELRRLEVGD